MTEPNPDDLRDVLDDDADDFDGPRIDTAVEVRYPADFDSPLARRAAGRTVRIRIHSTPGSVFAAKRAAWHLANGATSARVVERTWTASEWTETTGEDHHG